MFGKVFLKNISNFRIIKQPKNISLIETKIPFLDNEEINRESRDILFPGTLFGLFSIKKLHMFEKV